ncbi:MAG TPA: hypothetical protein VLM42_11265 [Bryobacteraceae bacterium]|nr:hypothetical protein [Bryobacteraceae bacterium]
MQDRYVADIGDFGKYALLRALAGNDLRLGVHWYRNADEETNRDGRFTDYLHLRGCDPPLYDALHDLLCSGRRSIPAVESANVLPSGTVFHSSPLSSRNAQDRTSRLTQRLVWNAQALDVLASADIIFLDPDNGFPGRSAKPASITGSKYVFPDELKPYLQREQSLVVYHHQTREKGGLATTLPLKFHMLRSLGFEHAWAFIFRRVSVRVYFILPAPRHTADLEARSARFLNTEWGLRRHFQLVRP